MNDKRAESVQEEFLFTGDFDFCPLRSMCFMESSPHEKHCVCDGQLSRLQSAVVHPA